ncbi:hypothetical protein CCACVL1_06407 [Corchorus capsularis]|uniref:Uncharacterized protein n=1 Tax=Corchorus capsularis TaxID=210143 RepID=A0A1R3JFP0_COCAP|nr:hypothetical protein CCACVL1_06407 [Corchorus capsularis]
MEKASFNMKFFVLVLVASSMMLILTAPGTQGQKCTSQEQCQPMVKFCISGKIRCNLENGNCECVTATFGRNLSCSTNAECNKK